MVGIWVWGMGMCGVGFVVGARLCLLSVQTANRLLRGFVVCVWCEGGKNDDQEFLYVFISAFFSKKTDAPRDTVVALFCA